MPTPKHKGMKYQYMIGIDPGVTTGYAIRDTLKKEYVEIGSNTILRVQEIIEDWRKFYDIFVRVEDARKRKWFGKKQREVLQGAGSIKRDCQIWEEFLTANKIPHEFVAPKDNKTKLDAKKFKLYTGHQGKTNEHSRDAGSLLLGY
jgi:hypothetical protein